MHPSSQLGWFAVILGVAGILYFGRNKIKSILSPSTTTKPQGMMQP